MGGEPMKSATNSEPGVRRFRAALRSARPCPVHDRDLVGQRHRLMLVMRDIDRGRAEPVVEHAQFPGHDMTQFGIQRAQRLVHQEGLGRARSPGRARRAGGRRRTSPRSYSTADGDAQEPGRLDHLRALISRAPCPGI